MALKKSSKLTSSVPKVEPATGSAKNPISTAGSTPPVASTSVDVSDLDELTYELRMEGLKRQERGHNLRGQTAKVEQSRLAADKEELKVTRRQIELEIEGQKVIKASDDLKGHTANVALNRAQWGKQLSQKAYSISGDVSYLQKAQAAVKSTPLESLSSIDGAT